MLSPGAWQQELVDHPRTKEAWRAFDRLDMPTKTTIQFSDLVIRSVVGKVQIEFRLEAPEPGTYRRYQWTCCMVGGWPPQFGLIQNPRGAASEALAELLQRSSKRLARSQRDPETVSLMVSLLERHEGLAAE